MATTTRNKSVKFHRRGFCIDDETVAMIKELAEVNGLKMSSAIRLAVREAHREMLAAKQGAQQQVA